MGCQAGVGGGRHERPDHRPSPPLGLLLLLLLLHRRRLEELQVEVGEGGHSGWADGGVNGLVRHWRCGRAGGRRGRV